MNAAPATHYLSIVRRNEETLKVLSVAADQAKHDASDWIITIHFYILCLYAKALGVCRGQNFQDHISIRRWLNTDADTMPMAKSYRKVEEASRDARYEGALFTSTDCQRFERWFLDARDHLVRLLKKQGFKPPVVIPVPP
jgi:hypothetical protein